MTLLSTFVERPKWGNIENAGRFEFASILDLSQRDPFFVFLLQLEATQRSGIWQKTFDFGFDPEAESQTLGMFIRLFLLIDLFIEIGE